MATVASLVERFLQKERGAANLLSPDAVTAQAIAAASLYAGFAALGDEPVGELDESVDLNDSEWALIRPLFLLYVEREQALHVEATAMMGVAGFGRTTSEISGEIAQLEREMPRLAFSQPIITV